MHPPADSAEYSHLQKALPEGLLFLTAPTEPAFPKTTLQLCPLVLASGNGLGLDLVDSLFLLLGATKQLSFHQINELYLCASSG